MLFEACRSFSQLLFPCYLCVYASCFVPAIWYLLLDHTHIIYIYIYICTRKKYYSNIYIVLYCIQIHLTSRCTTLYWPWYNLHSDISKKCLALSRRIDFDILGVKIRVLEFHKTTFFLQNICSTLALFSSMVSADLFGGFAQPCKEDTWLTRS